MRAIQETCKNSSQIYELESIRGLAAFLIVFFHLPKWNPVLDIGLVNNGYLMVELFFVLSGFVIFSAYADKIDCTRDIIRFYFLRFCRLYPVHITFLFVFLAIEFAKYIASVQFGIISPNSNPFEKNDLSAFIKHLLLISSVLPDQPLTYNYPAWSISVEFYTYLIFAAIAFLLKKNRDLIFGTFAFVSLIMLVTDLTFGFHDLLRCFSGFFIGCLTAKFSRKIKSSPPSLLSLLLFFLLITFIHFKPERSYDSLIYFIGAALIAALALSQDGFLNRILACRFLIWLGTISYSMYMSHAAVEWFANQVIRMVLKRPEIAGASGRLHPQLSELETLIACMLVIAGVLLVSALTYNFIEKPWREKSRNFASLKLGGRIA